jgi:MFS family permease
MMMCKRKRRFGPGNGVLLLICLLYLIQYSDRVNIATAAGPISHELHLSNTELGFALSAFAYPYAVVQLFGGWLGDKLGPRRVLACFGLIVACSSFMTAFAGSLITLAACRFLLGLGEAPSLATATSAMARWLPAERRGLAQGLTHACSRLGNAITPPLVVLLIGFWGWPSVFVAAGVVGAVWVVVWYAYFRDDPRTHPGVSPADLAAIGDQAPAGLTAHVPVRPLFVRMLPVMAVDFCYAWTLWVFLTWLPSFFSHSYHLNLSHSAFYTSGVFVAGIVGDALGGWVSDRIYQRTGDAKRARRNVIIFGLAGALVFLVPVMLLTDLRVVAACLCCAFFSMELVIAPLWAVPMDIAPLYSGTASSFMNIGFALAGIASPLAFGYLIDVSGNWHLPFALSIALLCIGIAMSFVMHPERRFEQAQAPETLRGATMS